MKIGVISDTHGLLRTEALEALAGVEHILHAGDIGHLSILEALQEIAPVTAICGNTDTNGPCAFLPAIEVVELGDRLFYMLHAIDDLQIDPHAAKIAAVIYGHSHQPSIVWKNGVLYLNPGSAGPRRFSLPVTVAIMTIPDNQNEPLQAEIVPLLP